MAYIQPSKAGQTMIHLDALLAELTRVVQETLQPELVSVWLRPPVTQRLDDAPSSSGKL